jgi:hypothetical protein
MRCNEFCSGGVFITRTVCGHLRLNLAFYSQVLIFKFYIFMV